MEKKLIVFLAAFCLTLAAITLRREAVTVGAEAEFSAPVIVIDPGHGGVDGGTVGIGGVVEKDVNLAISLRLNGICRFFGLNTVMTRSDDRSIHDPTAKTVAEMKRSDLKNRADLVNSTQDAVLISVHMNSYPSAKVHGAQIFYADTANSEILAQSVQDQTNSLVKSDRVPKPANDVFLMRSVHCPAIIAECGFLSNFDDTKFLCSVSGQSIVAIGLFSGLTQYLSKEV